VTELQPDSIDGNGHPRASHAGALHQARPATLTYWPSNSIVIRMAIAAAPYAHAGGDMGYDFAFVLLLGLIPFLALPVMAMAVLLMWRTSWIHRVWSLLVLAFSMLVSAAVFGSHAFDNLPWCAVPLFWIVPLIAWIASIRWIGAR
jgi:hypothetical protein